VVSNDKFSSLFHTQQQDFFDGMFTTGLPPHILPMFSSWSLIILGSASLYNPSKGVEQVGYFAGSNFLLLWDIPVDVTSCSESTEQTPAPNIVESQEELWPAPGEIPKPKPPPTVAVSTPANTHLPLFQTMTKIQSQANEIQLTGNSKVFGKTKRPNSKESTSVKAYIGHEYECPRGHR
jgi:Uncharacterized conserved protein (DUF2146).